MAASANSPSAGGGRKVTTEKVTIFYRPTIGGMVGASLISAAMHVRALMELSADFSRRIAAARTRFFASFPDGPDFCAASEEFGQLLVEKDLQYLMLAFYNKLSSRPNFGRSPDAS